jgi:alpha/beta superfamily hydrolase
MKTDTRINLLSWMLLGAAYATHTGVSLAQEAPATPQRGQLLETPPTQLGTYAVSDLLSKLSNGWLTQEILKLTFQPTCSVTVYHLQYGTIGGQGEATTASAALMIPSGSDSRCQGPRPIVLYAHGKRNFQNFNIADLSGNSNYEGLLVALILAADGYIAIAPNYAGYDTSTLSYHPYLNGDQQSGDMVDALAAAHTAFATTGSVDNQKLFVTGYSQGGYVAMATHRALQAAGIQVTASAPMSGPYALSAFGDAVFMGAVSAGATEQFAMLASSYEHSYGNLYSDPSTMFATSHLMAADSLLPGATGVDTLVAEGFLPASALFDSTPPAPEFAAMTPATTPGNLAQIFANGFGTDHLITNTYRLNYLLDASSAPDGGFPNTTTGLPSQSPLNSLRQDLKRNDLRNWTPTAPMLLCAGHEDPVVFYLNTQLMQGYWATNAPNSAITVLDIDSSPGDADPFADLKEHFRYTKDLIKLDAEVHSFFHRGGESGSAAVLKDYHALLVSAFCIQATRSFFDGY